MKKMIICLIIGMLILPTSLHKARNNDIITAKLINAIIKVESNFNPKAISNKGAIGLMQIRYSVWKNELKKHNIINTKQDLFNKSKNVKAGVFILRHYLKKNNNDLEKALVKYSSNATNYYNKVMANMPKEWYGKYW